MRINERMQDHEEVLVALERSLISRMRKLCGIYRAATERGNILLRIMDDGLELTRKYVNRRLDVLHKLLKTSDDSIAAIRRNAASAAKPIRRSSSASATASP